MKGKILSIISAGAKEITTSGPFQGQDSYTVLRQSKSIQGKDDDGIRVDEAGQDKSFGLDVTDEDEV